MTRLFIIRHAIAEDRDIFKETGLPDEERPLTADGKKKMEKISQRLFEKFPEIDRFIQSPLRRSQQTVDVLVKDYKKSGRSTSEHLAPEGSFEALIKELKGFGNRTLAIVGHEDHLSRFTHYLMTAEKTMAPFKFKKGGGACLEFPEEIKAGEAQLLWLYTAKLINI